ncbi:hypothetical protein QJS10_CPA08g00909 [Acorus calamus]|uniref:Uncharacterized protein n=1 Tax=Acorus calamus TaxID=4465 RepID=A0AAV9E9T9_ACOCL|nr:hypothetical protein QJS10_CPA08g00909 [Acorus calamus]
MVRQVWQWLGDATNLIVVFGSMEEMWKAGRLLCTQGNRSKAAKISQTFVPAMIWLIWLAKNQAIFRGQVPYPENIWEEVIACICNWGHFCALASSVRLVRGKLEIQE